MALERLGDEHDQALLAKVERALRKVGAKRRGHRWGLGGSQELVRQEWDSRWGLMVLESETYMGLTLEGPDEAVGAVIRLLSE